MSLDYRVRVNDGSDLIDVSDLVDAHANPIEITRDVGGSHLTLKLNTAATYWEAWTGHRIIVDATSDRATFHGRFDGTVRTVADNGWLIAVEAEAS